MDAYAESAALVRAADRDRYLADLFAPGEARKHLFVLHAFNVEVSAVRERVSDPTLGEIRLQWWRDAIAGEAVRSPMAEALVETVGRFRLPTSAFDRLLRARVFDLYDDPMPTLNDLEGYAGDTSSALMQLGAIVLAEGNDPGTADLAGHAGVAFALTGLLRALPHHAAARRSFLPADLVAEHGASMGEVFAGHVTDPLRDLLARLRAVARKHLEAARGLIAGLPPALLPAFLPLALVEPHLRRMERRGFDPLHDPAELSPWRRQWAMWRAARAGRA